MKFEIDGDASKADKAIDDVLVSLDRVEAEARAAGLSITSAFAASQAAATKAANEAKRAAEAHTTFAQRVNAVADELVREEQMLQRIQGPAKEMAANLKTLATLHSQGAITAEQYVKTLEKMGYQFGHTAEGAARLRAEQAKQAMSTIGLPAPKAVGGGGAGVMSGLAGGAAMLGIGIGVQQLTDIADGYTQIQNRLRQLTPDQAAANALFEKLQGVASRSRSDLGATVDAYQSMSRATKTLGLSQGDTIKVTETLSKLVTASGRSAAESSAGLLQFGQALSSGRLQGDELRSVFENMPTLVDALTSSLGVSQARLREMGSEGAITSKIMIDALMGAAESADASLGKTLPTIGQAITQVKNDIIVSLGPALQTMATGLISVGKTVSGAIGVLGEFASMASKVGTALEYVNPLGWGKRLLGAVNDATTAFDSVYAGVKRIQEVQDVYEGRVRSLAAATTEGKDAVNAWHIEQTQLNLSLTVGATAALAFANATKDMGREAALTASEFRELFMAGDALDHFGKVGRGGFRKGDDIDQFNSMVLSKGIDTTTADGANKNIAARKAEVDSAQQLLKSLEMQWQSIDHGRLTTALYAQEKTRLQAIIDGTVGSLKKEKEAHLDLLAMIRERLAVEESARKMRGVDSMRGAEREQFFGLLGMDPTDGPMFAGRGDKEFKESIEADKAAADLAKVAAEAEKARTDALTHSWKMRTAAVEAHNEKMKELGATIKPVADSLIDMFMAGDFSAKRFVDTLQDVAIQLLKTAAIQALGGSGFTGASFLTGLLGGANGFDHFTGGAGGLQLPGFANGGDMIMRGPHGGTDANIAAFRYTDGESLHVRTPQQRREAANSNGGGMGDVNVTPVIKVQMPPARRDIVDRSRDGMTTLVELEHARRPRG